ncbi:hypothetical protein SADUNF_Sadunf16G0294300 [Salix dunnii]|uniref:Peptidase S8/S53 domain-containing protein n=1 Tax=Salix dunnii TaxID=1413687 RepID=A0A835J9G9_9ROSI|nr:hypothetical protein SADUNF_Sadunf16G0294300 [Salix dunnii]
MSLRDGNGHGTHTASITTARGGAPLAPLAMYKVCWNIENGGCTDANLLKAFDKAIHDGADILSVSIGNDIPLFSYVDMRNSIAIGSFHATSEGITVVCSAGIAGPISQTIVNTPPWLIIVSASTDCQPGSLNETLAAGKIILCLTKSDTQGMFSASRSVFQAGGGGLIFAQFHDDRTELCEWIPCVKGQIFPASDKLGKDCEQVKARALSLSLTHVSPRVASFSSGGPSSITPEVLKI